MSTSNLGVTVNDFNGIRADFQVVSGIDTLICDLAARLLGKNFLINLQDPDYGIDLQSMIHGDLDDYEVTMISVQIENQMKLDPRVQSCKVTGTADFDTNECTFFIRGTAVNNQQFSFIGEMRPGVLPTFKITK